MAHAIRRTAHRPGQRIAGPRRLAAAAVAALCLVATAIAGCSTTPDAGPPAGNFSLLQEPPPESPQTVEQWMAQPRVNP